MNYENCFICKKKLDDFDYWLVRNDIPHMCKSCYRLYLRDENIKLNIKENIIQPERLSEKTSKEDAIV